MVRVYFARPSSRPVDSPSPLTARPYNSAMTENLELAVLSDVVARLQSAHIDYMLTGSVAMNYYAEPRVTRDIDIVVALADADADKVIEAFEKDYYLSRDAVVEAVRHQRIFNLVHYQNVVKVDMIVR